MPRYGDISGALSGAGYVVTTADDVLQNERILTGTTNQVVVTDNGAGSTVVLSTPQNIHTGASPTFTGLTLSGLTEGSIVFAGSSGLISQDNANFFYLDSANQLLLGGTTAAGADIILGADGATVFNEQGNDADSRFEGSTQANLLFIDTGNDRVGIKTNAPTATFHITPEADEADVFLVDHSAGATAYTGTGTYTAFKTISDIDTPDSDVFLPAIGFDTTLTHSKGMTGDTSASVSVTGFKSTLTTDGIHTATPFLGEPPASIKGSDTTITAKDTFTSTKGGSIASTGNDISVNNNDVVFNNGSGAFISNATGLNLGVNNAPTLTAGTLTATTVGLLMSIVGDTAGTSIARGIEITNVQGADTNWAFYSPADIDTWHRGQFAIGGTGEIIPTGMLDIVSDAASVITNIIKGAVSQTANLTEWRDSSDVVIAIIDENGAFVFNENSIDADSRIEGNGDVNLTFWDAGNDRVGMGTSTPAVKLDVDGHVQSLRRDVLRYALMGA